MENEGNEGTALADKIWIEYYKVQYSKRYFELLAHIYWRRDRFVRGLLALVTSTVIAGLNFWSKIPVVWEISSAVAVVFAVLNTVLGFPKSMSDSEKLVSQYASLSTQYKRLMLSAEHGGDLKGVEQEFTFVMGKEELVSVPAKFSKYKKKLQEKSGNEVGMNEGIEVGGA